VSEFTKTGLFGAGALLALVLAVAASFSGRTTMQGDDSLQELFPDFTDATAATGMQIVKFDEDTSELHTFKVGKRDNVWVIPSKSDYPADASKRLADAATALIGVRRGPKVSEQRSSHATYGLIEPSQNLEQGMKGVGQLVVLEADNDKTLAELVVGKEVKERFGWRYVRIRGQDPVYEVKIEADKFSTKFEEWIERDVLRMKLREGDTTSKLPEQRLTIQRVVVEDYEAQLVRGPKVSMSKERDRLDLRYDDSATDNKWMLADLAEGKELVETKLNDLRFALGDVKIVDVYRKPQGLRDMLAGKSKAGIREEEMFDLFARGFFPLEQGLYCSSGEVIVETKEGLIYVLNFGNIVDKTFEQREAERQKAEQQPAGGKKPDDAQSDTKKDQAKEPEKGPLGKKEGAKPDASKKDASKKGDEKAEGPVGSNRYLFVQVDFNKGLVPKPKIKHVFGESHLPVKPAAGKGKEGEAKAGKEKDDGEQAEKEAAVREPKLADSVKELLRLEEERLVDKAEFETRRKELEDSNKMAQKEYDEKMKAAQERVKELNERFADWYYVIDDETFKKIRVKRADIIQDPEKKDDKKNEPSKAKFGDDDLP
jgi:hypothetical protein